MPTRANKFIIANPATDAIAKQGHRQPRDFVRRLCRIVLNMGMVKNVSGQTPLTTRAPATLKFNISKSIGTHGLTT